MSASGDKMNVEQLKRYPTLGSCGLDCGMCPNYYTEGDSRCPGCGGPDFHKKHPSCGFLTCCAKEHGLEVCAECGEFPCKRFDPLYGSDEVYDSFVTYRNVREKMEFIRKNGVKEFISEQKKRIELLGTMLDEYNDGRSKSFYCIAATLLPTADIKRSLKAAEGEITARNVEKTDLKGRAKILKGILTEASEKNGIQLKLRKKKIG